MTNQDGFSLDAAFAAGKRNIFLDPGLSNFQKNLDSIKESHGRIQQQFWQLHQLANDKDCPNKERQNILKHNLLETRKILFANDDKVMESENIRECNPGKFRGNLEAGLFMARYFNLVSDQARLRDRNDEMLNKFFPDIHNGEQRKMAAEQQEFIHECPIV